MGCFDVACGISGITIKRQDDALLLLLIPQTDYGHNLSTLPKEVKIHFELMQVHNEGPMGLFMPFCLPIRGKYNDYGLLEDIIKDETVVGLENYFGLNIEQILEILRDNNEYSDSIYSRDSIINYYGTGEIKSHDSAKTTAEWLLKIGFIEQQFEGNTIYVHKDTPKLQKWNGKEWYDIEIPRNYVIFKQQQSSPPSKDIIAHIVYHEMITDNTDRKNPKYDYKRKDVWARDRKDLVERFYEYSKSFGFFSDDKKIAIGIKPEYIKKANVLRKISGMFIDGVFYNNFTSTIQTNSYAKENSDILNTYPTKFIIEKIGFKFERYGADETLEPVEPPKNKVTYKDKDKVMVYSHPLAPNHLFSIKLTRNMCLDFYQKNKNNKWEEIKTYQPSVNKNYHPFSALGIKKMFEGECGNELDLSPLNDYTLIDVRLAALGELMHTHSKIQQRVEALDLEIKKMKEEADGDKEKKLYKENPKYKEIVDEWIDLTNKTESRDNDKDILGDFNFPLVYKMYATHFVKPSKKFKQQLKQHKNFISSLWGINRLLMPSAHFGQHGDMDNHVAFAKILLETSKQKILQDYARDYSSKEELINLIVTLYSDDYVETEPQKTKHDFVETMFKHKGEPVAIWRKDSECEYGFLITEKGH